jgi:hypothetical protein
LGDRWVPPTLIIAYSIPEKEVVMYKIDSAGRPRLNGKFVPVETLPTSKRFDTDAGPCVVVARSLEERAALANADKPEDLEGFKEALAVVQG